MKPILKVHRKGTRQMIASVKPRKCIVPGCDAEASKTRGVCQNCYAAAKRLVDRGLSTWEELEFYNLILPPHTKRIEDRPLFIALEAARAVSGKKKPKASSSSK
jgi:hypothetical protein